MYILNNTTDHFPKLTSFRLVFHDQEPEDVRTFLPQLKEKQRQEQFDHGSRSGWMFGPLQLKMQRLNLRPQTTGQYY